jgi:hypothetical protein
MYIIPTSIIFSLDKNYILEKNSSCSGKEQCLMLVVKAFLSYLLCYYTQSRSIHINNDSHSIPARRINHSSRKIHNHIHSRSKVDSRLYLLLS